MTIQFHLTEWVKDPIGGRVPNYGGWEGGENTSLMTSFILLVPHFPCLCKLRETSSSRLSARPYIWVRAIPNKHRMEQEQLWEGLGGAGGQEAQHEPGNVHSQARKPNVSWAAFNAVWAAGWRRGFCSPTLLRWHPTHSAVSSPGVPCTRKTWTCWSWSRGDKEKDQRARATLP